MSSLITPGWYIECYHRVIIRTVHQWQRNLWVNILDTDKKCNFGGISMNSYGVTLPVIHKMLALTILQNLIVSCPTYAKVFRKNYLHFEYICPSILQIFE